MTDRSQTIKMLQEVQERIGYIAPEAISWLAERLKLSEQEIYGVATFYNFFRLNPPGKHEVKVCLGTACHVQGNEKIFDAARERLGIDQGETTSDGRYSLIRVACVGCCALAPTVIIDKEVYGRMTQRELQRLLNQIDKEDIQSEKGKRINK
ncbi:MAG: NADH-quinone oxidoreductase subunit NuoE [Candidatus Bathyarchaeota archaeon]